MALAYFPDGVQTPTLYGVGGLTTLNDLIALYPTVAPAGTANILSWTPTFALTGTATHRGVVLGATGILAPGTSTYAIQVLRNAMALSTVSGSTTTLNSTTLTSIPTF